MAPIFLVMILLGIAAKMDARPYDQDIPGDDQDAGFNSAQLLAVLGNMCDNNNRPLDNVPPVMFSQELFDVVCWAWIGVMSGKRPSVIIQKDSTRGNWTYNFEHLVESVTPERDLQRGLSDFADRACRFADLFYFGDVTSDISESICRLHRQRIDADDGGESGSGAIFSGSGEDDEDDDGFSIEFSSDYDGLENDAFYFRNNY